MVSPLELAIQFLEDFGLFKVVLPFLLVFTLMFAILEKTRILGTVEYKDKQVPNKALNAMFSFVVALFVVATPSVVDFLQISLPRIIMVLVVLISFMLLLGSFYGTKEFDISTLTNTGFKVFLIITLLIGVILIALSAIYADGGKSWLTIFWEWMLREWAGTVFGSIILFIIMIIAIIIIVGKTKEKES